MYPKAEITYSDKDSLLLLRESRCSRFFKKVFRLFLALLTGVLLSSIVSEGIYFSVYKFSGLSNTSDLLEDNCLLQLPFYIWKRSYDAKFLRQVAESQSSTDMRIGLEQISQEYSSTAGTLTERLISQFKYRQQVLTYDPMLALLVINAVMLIFFITIICLHPDKPQTMYGNRLQGYKRLMWIRWYFLCFCWIFFLWGACHLGKALAIDCSRRF